MHNPFTSEADAFRLVVIIGAGAAAVIALTLLTEPLYGGLLAALLIGLGIGLAWRDARGSLPQKADVAASGDAVHRILVVANETVGGEALLGEIRNRSRGYDRSEVLVVTPALTHSRLQYLASDVDGARADAADRLDQSVATLEAAGFPARGERGNEDPNVAIEDALRLFAADEVIISTHPPERSRWLEHGVVERARSEIDLPITHVIVDLEAEAPAR